MSTITVISRCFFTFLSHAEYEKEKVLFLTNTAFSVKKLNEYIFLTSCRLFAYYDWTFKHQENVLPLINLHYPVYFVQTSVTIIHFLFFLMRDKLNWTVSSFSLTPKKSMILPGSTAFHDISKISRFPGRVITLP